MITAVRHAMSLRSFGFQGLAVFALATAPRAEALGQAARDTAAFAAARRMQVPGPEEKALARRAGTWNVVVTIQPAPDMAPIVTSDLVAERTMVGLYLQEIMRPAPGSTAPDFRRIAYSYYSRVEGRWHYVSLDTRFPVGIMPAWSYEKQTGDTLTLEFENIAFVGIGGEVEGRMTHSNLVVIRESDDHEVVRQYWTRADGTARTWLAVQYDYTRRR